MRSVHTALVVIGVVLSAPAAAEPWRLGSPLELTPRVNEDDARASLSFTPRLPGVFDLDEARVTLTYTPLDENDNLVAGRQSAEGFAIGGALALNDMVIRGELAQTASGLTERDDFEAALEVGDLTTRMSYAEVGGVGVSGESRYALGADLAAAPGLSVGAGLSYGLSEEPSVSSDTTGIVRFRLSF